MKKKMTASFLLCLFILPLVSKAETTGKAFLVKNWQKPHRQAVSLITSNLKLNAEFPLHINQHMVITGNDDLNKPYKLELTTKEQTPGIFHTSFKLSRGKQVESSSIVFDKNSIANVSTDSEDIFHKLEFETRIIE